MESAATHKKCPAATLCISRRLLLDLFKLVLDQDFQFELFIIKGFERFLFFTLSGISFKMAVVVVNGG